jgi:hypothetical protein
VKNSMDKWFIYKRLVEDEADASGCLSEIISAILLMVD